MSKQQLSMPSPRASLAHKLTYRRTSASRSRTFSRGAAISLLSNSCAPTPPAAPSEEQRSKRNVAGCACPLVVTPEHRFWSLVQATAGEREETRSTATTSRASKTTGKSRKLGWSTSGSWHGVGPGARHTEVFRGGRSSQVYCSAWPPMLCIPILERSSRRGTWLDWAYVRVLASGTWSCGCLLQSSDMDDFAGRLCYVVTESFTDHRSGLRG